MDKTWKYRLSEERIMNSSEVQIILPFLKCSICYNLLWNAQSCQTCNQKFCTTCISDYIQEQYTQNPKCPFRCIFIKCRPDILLYQLLNLVNFNCINYEGGCKDVLKYDSIEKHEIICKFQKKICGVCKLYFTLENFNVHKETCANNNNALNIIPKFSNVYKSNLIELTSENKVLILTNFDFKFHVAFGEEEMSEGIYKWKLFFKSNNDSGVGMVAGIAEMTQTPKLFNFERFVDIYQAYQIYACTIWKQLWINSINDVSKSFQDNRWDNKWWEYCLDFNKKKFIITYPDGNQEEFNIKEGIYRVYVEVGYLGNTFEISEVKR